MKWLVSFLTSSIGRKIIMSLTGLFLCTFLVVHMIGNLKLFADTDGHKFNEYTEFMTHNPLIKIVSYGTYFFILLHAIQGFFIAFANKAAIGGGKRYHGKEISPTEVRLSARNMAMLGTLVLAFILLHMWQFWAQMKMGTTEMISYEHGAYDHPIKNLYVLVQDAFRYEWVVIVYLIGLVALAMHLMHGFQSAFQTLGLNHKKYTPLIKGLGLAYSILVPLGFATMPIYFYIIGMNP